MNNGNGQFCAHCGLPLRAAAKHSETAYCCFGCSLAHAAAGKPGEETPELSAVNYAQARLLLAGFFGMNLMIFATVNYGRHVFPEAMTEQGSLWKLFDNLINWISLLFTLPIVALLMPPLVKNVMTSLRRREPGSDALVVLATSSALLMSTWSTLTGHGPVYFESAGIVLILVALGRLLEARWRVNMLSRFRLWADPGRETQRRITVTAGGETVEDVSLPDLREGDVLVLYPGQTLYTDGLLISGAVSVDKSVVTGESLPVECGPGSELLSLMTVTHGQGRLRVTRTGADAFRGRLETMMRQAQATRTSAEKWVEKTAFWFTPVLLALGVAAFGLHAGAGSGRGVQAMFSVWLIGCPCALTLATPLALIGVLSRLIQEGVLLKDMAVLEDLGKIKTVFLDKTRTLTGFDPVLSGKAYAGIRPEEAALLTRSLEAHSRHPLSQALLKALPGAVRAPVNIEEIAGKGIEGDFGGGTVKLGDPDWVFGGNAGALAPAMTDMKAQGSRLVAGRSPDGDWVYGLGEDLRPGAATAVTQLKTMGLAPVLLSGDDPIRVKMIARTLGITGEGGLLPQDKLARLKDQPGAMMVGDGLNDTAALAAAHVGVAFACGTDLVREAARALVLGDDPMAVPLMLEAAKVAARRIRFCLAWAAGYNLAAVGLALSGWLNPLLAALAMVASSVSVTAAALLMEVELPGSSKEKPVGE